MMGYVCQIRQPHKLESLALAKIGHWIVSHVDKLLSPAFLSQESHIIDGKELSPEQIEKITKYFDTINDEISSIRLYPESKKQLLLQNVLMHKGDRILSQTISTIQNYLRRNISGIFWNDLFIETKQALFKVAQRTNDDLILVPWECYNDVRPWNVLKRIMETLFNKHITSLKDHRIFRASLFYKSHMLTGLTYLELEREHCQTESELIQLLKELHALKYLITCNGCTNNVLLCLIENCKEIEHLDLTESLIRDDSIPLIIKLPKLRRVTLYMTAVTEIGIKTLLTSCENINHIDTNICIIKCLKQIITSEENAGRHFNLTYFGSILERSTTSEDIQLLAKMCPQIQTVHMTRHRYHSVQYLTPLSHLQHLCEILLEGYSFHEDDIKDLLNIKGHALVNLYLNVSLIDLNSLKHVFKTCPNLEKLTIDYRLIPKTYGKDINKIFPNETGILPLQRLKKLTLIGKCDNEGYLEEHILFMISHSPYVEEIHISEIAPHIEIVLEEILQKNPKNLMNLKELWSPHKISMSLINQLLKNCKKPLKILAESCYAYDCKYSDCINSTRSYFS